MGKRLLNKYRMLVKSDFSYVVKNKPIKRFKEELSFRAEVALYFSLLFNLAYSVFKLVLGIMYRSKWMDTIGIYYMLLAVIRFLIIRQVRHGKQDEASVWKTYRICAKLLLVMDLFFSSMVMQMVYENQGYNYSGYIIYAAAAYTFYCLDIAIVNTVRYYKLGNPLLSASKAISLTKALASMLYLQTAMFASFGGDEDFRQRMNLLTGIVICICQLDIALWMLYRSRRMLKIAIEEDSMENPAL